MKVKILAQDDMEDKERLTVNFIEAHRTSARHSAPLVRCGTSIFKVYDNYASHNVERSKFQSCLPHQAQTKKSASPHGPQYLPHVWRYWTFKSKNSVIVNSHFSSETIGHQPLIEKYL